MSLFDRKTSPAQIEAVSQTGWLARTVRPVGLLVGALGVASLFLLPQARFDADPMALRAKTAPSVIAFNDIVEEEGATPYRLNVLAQTQEDLLSKAELLKRPESVDSTRHLLSFVPEDQDLKLSLIDATAVGLGFALISGGEVAMQDDPAMLPSTTTRLMAALREDGGEAALALLSVLDQVGADDIQAAEPRIFKFWPQQRQALSDQLRANFVTVADVPAQLRKRYITEDGTYRLEVLPVGGGVELADRRRFVNEVLALAPDAAGSARTALSAGDIIGRAMVQASVTAAILVSLLVFVIVRSWRLLILLLIPLILAGSLTTATGTLFDLPYNFANVLVLPLIIGIGIDSGLHLALRAERSSNALDAVRGPTGRAVIFSALTTIASFGSLVVSDHRGTSSMGALLTIGMVWVLATMLFVLPPLAELLYGRRMRTHED